MGFITKHRDMANQLVIVPVNSIIFGNALQRERVIGVKGMSWLQRLRLFCDMEMQKLDVRH